MPIIRRKDHVLLHMGFFAEASLLSRHVSGIFMPIIRRKDHVLLRMGFFAASVGCGLLRFCGATL